MGNTPGTAVPPKAGRKHADDAASTPVTHPCHAVYEGVMIPLDAPGKQAQFSFSGTAGQTIAITGKVPVAYATGKLVSPSGKTVATGVTAINPDWQVLIAPVVLPETGTAPTSTPSHPTQEASAQSQYKSAHSLLPLTPKVIKREGGVTGREGGPVGRLALPRRTPTARRAVGTGGASGVPGVLGVGRTPGARTRPPAPSEPPRPGLRSRSVIR